MKAAVFLDAQGWLMVEESPPASLGSRVSGRCSKVGAFLTHCGKRLWGWAVSTWTAGLETHLCLSNPSTVIQTACVAAVGLRNLAPKLDWQPKLSAVIPSHRMAVMRRQGRMCALQTCKSPSHTQTSLTCFVNISSRRTVRCPVVFPGSFSACLFFMQLK